ncbi:MAG TPA: hypothetical protein VE344_03650 [Methylomirabilota bacterium]|nr:hypothetical protein [Methylomirabilota bacterium]
MTETQAHEFVARWNRIIFPRRVRTEAETIREVRRRLFIVMFFTFLLVFISLWISIRIPQIGSKMSLAGIFNFLLFSFSIWQILRLRQARRVLDQSQTVNRESQIING